MDKINNKNCASCDLVLKDDTKELGQLIGKKIVNIGIAQDRIEGGLCIDYEDGKQIKRIVMAFNELGMWMHWHGQKGTLNKEDVLKLKIEEFLDNVVDLFSVKIIDRAKDLCYDFIDNENNGVSVSISINELKIIMKKRPELGELFSKQDKDVEKIMPIINEYCFGF